MTRWSAASSIRAEVKLFSRNTRWIENPPSRTSASPARAAGWRQVRPTEAAIDGRDHEQADEACRGEGPDDLLRQAFLGERAAFHAALEQRRIVLQQMERQRRRPAETDSEEDPGLPIVERPGRTEQQRGRRDEQADEARDGTSRQAAHSFLLL